MATQFDPSRYYLGGLTGPGVYASPYFLNRQYQPTIQDILTRMNRPEITGMPGQPVYIDQMSNPQYVSRQGPDIFYKKKVSPLGTNLYPNVPGMGDFTPSMGLIGGDMQPSTDAEIAAAGGSTMPTAQNVDVTDVTYQENQPQAEAPQRTLGLLGDLFGGASALDEYMTPEQKAQLQNQGVMAAAMQLLAASGPSRVPVGLGQTLGEAYGAGQKGYTAAQQNLLTSMAMKQKMDEYKRELETQKSFQQWLTGGGGGEVATQPTAAITPDQAINAPGLPAGPTVARAAMIGAPSAAMPAVSAPSGAALLTPEQRMLVSNLPAKEGYKEAVRMIEQNKEYIGEPKTMTIDGKSVTVRYKKMGGYDVLPNVVIPEATPDDIKKLQAVGLAPTLENLQKLHPEGTPNEIKILRDLGLPLTLDAVTKLRQAGASQTNVSVNTGEKVRVGEINKDIVAEMGSLTAQARTAKETLMNVDRILPALDKAITGPLADYRTTLTRVGQYMGITGKDTNEILANTQNVVQGLAQQELNAASYTKGQGALTGPEREMLKRSAAGDQNMSAAELRTALIAAQKMAQYRMNEHQQYLSKFAALPGLEQYVPFYTVTPYQPAGGGNAVQSAIDAELAKRAQTQRGGGMR